MFDPRAEQLARELKALVGRRRHLLWLRERCPVLLELVRGRYPDVDVRLLAPAAIHELQAAASLRPPAEAESLRELLQLSRRYEGNDPSRRRENVIGRLGEYCAVETWRRSDGPEMAFLRDFAQALLIHLTA